LPRRTGNVEIDFKQSEETMHKGIVAIASALALISLGTLAQAGNGAQGTPKINNAGKSFHSQISEFSSSSAATHRGR
jgi:hypothetical protein